MNQNSIEIRTALPKDAAIIALLGRITFSESFSHFFRDKNDLLTYLDRTFSVEKIKNSILKSSTRYWIAYSDNLPVGYSKLKLNSPSPFINIEGVCQLQKIYVLNDFHSLKIGYQLQFELLETANSLNYKNIWLSVLDSNQKAINFYLNTGFKAVGTHDFQIGKEHFNFIVMSKIL